MSFLYEKLKDPRFFCENRLPAHSDHESFACMEDLLTGDNRLRFSLNGLWKFFHALNEGQVIPGFEKPEYDCSGWADIPVPAHIQMEGYGVPQYANIQYPWDGHAQIEPGEIPEDFNPVACYVKTFTLPPAMEGMPIRISFQGAESCVALWLNGHYVGFAGDSFTASDFDLTPYLTPGRNKLACRVYRWCAGSWAEDQDFYRFSGLFRDVFLYAIPAAHLQDVSILGLLDDAYEHGTLQIAATLEGNGAQAIAELRDGDTLLAKETLIDGKLSIPVASPRKWSAEDPFLYELTLSILDAQGNLREVVRQKVGFRRFEMKNGLMCLNGKRIVFKGVNRHDFCAEFGRATTPAIIRRDLLTMKRNNINAVRTSHYPNHRALYSLCDELGFYLIAENNLEAHGIWDLIVRGEKPLEYALPGNRPEWRAAMLDRVDSTYHLGKNHPSVLLWSCGNESIGGDVPFDMSERFRQLDNTRLVHYESIRTDRRRNDTSDVESQMYTPIWEIREYLSQHRDKPFILCEYVHAMGNSNGNMHKYTQYAYEEPLYQGGFIWDYIDQSIRTTDRYGKPAYFYGGDFGERPHDADFSCNGIVFGDGSETPKMQEIRYNYQDIHVEVEATEALIVNHSLFTNTSAYRCVATLARDGMEIQRKELDTHVAPGESQRISLPFAQQMLGGEYTITLSFRLRKEQPWAPMDHEIAFGQGIYTVAKAPVHGNHPALRVVHGMNNIGVHGEHFSVLFDTLRGRLDSYNFGGKEMLKAPPLPNFWRAPIENDYGNGMPARYAQWKLASLYAAPLREAQAFQQEEDGSVIVTLGYTLPTTPVAQCLTRYTVHPCGQVDVHLHNDPVEGLSEMPEFGMLFTLDAQYDKLRYYGFGPEENYCDRRHGAKLGIWQKHIPDNVTPYTLPQECGNRTGVRWAEVMDFRGRGLRFTGDGMEFSALPYTPHELENARHPNELPPIYNTILRVNMMQMGVGGDNSWGARTHDEYLLDVSKPLDFHFSFQGVLQR